MLVLTRGEWQSIIIRTPGGERIKVTVMARRKGKTRIGIEAHEDVRVIREECDNQALPDEAYISRADR